MFGTIGNVMTSTMYSILLDILSHICMITMVTYSLETILENNICQDI